MEIENGSNIMQIQSLLKKAFERAGGLYVILSIAAGQVLAFPAVILGLTSVSLNAEFSPNQTSLLVRSAPAIVLIVNAFLLVIAWYLTPNARKRLDQAVLENPPQALPNQEIVAWQEITALTWKFAAATMIATILLELTPISLYHFAHGHITQDQFIYLLMGGSAGILGSIVITTLVGDFLLLPARQALIPKTFEDQVNGRKGPRLVEKFSALVISMGIIIALIIAPLGYHYTVKAITERHDPLQLVWEMQVESILFTILTLALGFGLAFMASRAITNPVENLINIFKRIEQGNLSERAQVTATDEIADLAIHFNRMVAELESLRRDLEKQVQQQTAQMKAAYEVGNVASSILNPGELMEKVVNLITERLGHYYSAIFLVNQNWAELKAATGEAGKVLIQNKHRLDIAGKSLIGEAIREQRPCNTMDASASSLYFANPLLPYTRSEVALPLIVGDRVLGVLDVHSSREAAFTPQDMDTLQAMSNHVAIALENARLYEETQQSLKELRSIQQQYLLNTWSNLTSKQKLEYAVGDENQETPHALQVPLLLRDQSLGHIQLVSEGEWTPEEKNIAEAVAAQAAVALENARLINESRQTAARERLASDISNKIWSSATLDGVLQTVARELGRTLDADKLVIELNVKENAHE